MDRWRYMLNDEMAARKVGDMALWKFFLCSRRGMRAKTWNIDLPHQLLLIVVEMTLLAN